MTEFQQVQETPRKLYIFTRNDIPPGYQLAQAVHAGTQFAIEYPEYASYWNDNWKNLVCLQVPDEDRLLDILDIFSGWCSPLSYIDAPYTYFVEPDLNNEHTACAALLTEDQAKKFKKLPLSLRASSHKGGEV